MCRKVVARGTADSGGIFFLCPTFRLPFRLGWRRFGDDVRVDHLGRVVEVLLRSRGRRGGHPHRDMIAKPAHQLASIEPATEGGEERNADEVRNHAGRQEQGTRDENHQPVQEGLSGHAALEPILANPPEDSDSLRVSEHGTDRASHNDHQDGNPPTRVFSEQQEKCQIDERHHNEKEQQAKQHVKTPGAGQHVE